MWELVRAVKHGEGEGEQRLRLVADGLGIPLPQVRLAVDFYVEYPEEVDDRIADDERAASQVHDLIARRDRLMSG